jgi:hypothetical protein
MHEGVPVRVGEIMSKLPQIVIIIMTIVHWLALEKSAKQAFSDNMLAPQLGRSEITWGAQKSELRLQASVAFSGYLHGTLSLGPEDVLTGSALAQHRY